jgi:hypothetical protein
MGTHDEKWLAATNVTACAGKTCCKTYRWPCGAVLRGSMPVARYAPEFSADAIGQIVGLSPQNVATKIHRNKNVLTLMLHARGSP